MQYLKQSTAATIEISPVLNSDGTADTATSLTNTDFLLSKNGTASALHTTATAAPLATGDLQGTRLVTLDTTDTGTVGRLKVWIKHTGLASGLAEYEVLAAATFDAIVTNAAGAASGLAIMPASGNPKADVDTIKGQAVTCAAPTTVLASVGTAATSTAQTGDNYARIGAAGAGLTALGDTRLAFLDMFISMTPSAIAGRKIWFVDPAGSNTDGKTPTTAFTTVAAAITASASGDEIRIAAGTYAETLSVGTKALRFRGAGWSTTLTTSTTTPAMTVGAAAWLQIEDMQITGTYGPIVSSNQAKTLYCNATQNITLRNVYCSGPDVAAFLSPIVGKIRIFDCEFAGSEEGLFVGSSFDPTVANVVIENTYATAKNWSICHSSAILLGPCMAEIVNTFGFTASGTTTGHFIQSGLTASGYSWVTARNSVFRGECTTDQGTAAGVAVTSSAANVLLDSCQLSSLADGAGNAYDIDNYSGGVVRVRSTPYATSHGTITPDVAVDASGFVTFNNSAWTDTRAGKLDNLDAAVSTRSTFAGGAVASVTAGVTLATAAQNALVAAIEVELANDSTGQAFLEAIAAKLNSDFNLSTLTTLAISQSVRDAVLDTVLAGNHDLTGTLGKLIQAIAGVAPDHKPYVDTYGNTQIVLPTIPTGWIGADGIATGALNSKGDWNTTTPDNTKIGQIYSLLVGTYGNQALAMALNGNNILATGIDGKLALLLLDYMRRNRGADFPSDPPTAFGGSVSDEQVAAIGEAVAADVAAAISELPLGLTTEQAAQLANIPADTAEEVWASDDRSLTTAVPIVVGPTASSKPKIIQVDVLRNSTVPLNARVILATGQDAHIADISAITYSIYEVDAVDRNNWTVLPAFTDIELNPADVMRNSLATDNLATNFNFRHEPDVLENEAFTNVGAHYTVEYRLTPTVAGQEIVVRFSVTVI